MHGLKKKKKMGKGTESNKYYIKIAYLCGQAVKIISFSLKNNSLNCTPAGCKEQHTAYEDIEQQGAINFIKTIKACNKAR